MRAAGSRACRALALAAALATSGCYSLEINAFDVDQPVSLSRSIGQPTHVARHFRYDFVTWYGLGLIPLFSLPGPVPILTPGDRMVASVLRNELRRGGDGVTNLRVTQSYNWQCWVANYVPALLYAGIGTAGPGTVRVSLPLAPLWILTMQPMATTVEGDVVALDGATARPAAMITLAGDRLDTGGLDLRQLVVAGVRPRRAPR